MDINKRNRSELKSYFTRKAIPSESNFAEMLDGMLNQKDDGVVKQPGSPLSIQAAGDDASEKKVLDLYQTFADSSPEWTLGLHPRANPADAVSARRGLSVSTGGGVSRLFIDHTTGDVGVGTLAPQARLHVAGAARVDGDLSVATLHTTGQAEFAGNVKFTGPVVGPHLTWQALPLKTGWALWGAGFYDLEYSKDPFGVVHLRGFIKAAAAAAASAVLATLPDGYRPAFQSAHVTIANTVVNRLDIKSTGDIVLGVAMAINTGISLDGITFMAAAVAQP